MVIPILIDFSACLYLTYLFYLQATSHTKKRNVINDVKYTADIVSQINVIQSNRRVTIANA